MIEKVNSTRRSILKSAVVGTATASVSSCIPKEGDRTFIKFKSQEEPNYFSDSWSNSQDRVWLSGDVWANPMEDWRVSDGGVEVISAGGNRSIHCLTHEVTMHEDTSFSVQVEITRMQQIGPQDGGAGIRVGAKNETGDFRSHCFEQSGIVCGWRGDSLVLGKRQIALNRAKGTSKLTLALTCRSTESNTSRISVEAIVEGQVVGRISEVVSQATCDGNVALVSNFSLPAVDHGLEVDSDFGCVYRFSKWQMAGSAFSVDRQRQFGPILWAMYTLDKKNDSEAHTLKLSALIGPMSPKQSHMVSLEVKNGSSWERLATEQVIQDGWVATFRVDGWNASNTVPYRVVYDELRRDGTTKTHEFSGMIRSAPRSHNLTMAALTCQNDYAFPYSPVADNLLQLDPDMVFFSGDQLYENHGGFGFIREPSERSILNYLRKFYQFGWAFRDVMRDRPTVCLPDDHDVLQGNLWGEAGAEMRNPEADPGASVLGGYVEPVRVVNAVHRTCVAHHPDPIDPEPLDRGISVYFTELSFGGVSFAILADRQWKSGPERIGVQVGITGSDEEPQYINPDYDNDSLELLGERQEAFLRAWSGRWNGHSLKAVLSQTVFSGLATHQPAPDRYLKYDFDSSGWPPSARNRAIDCMRLSKALHICGDTHLGSLSQYGVRDQRDSNWVFCTPAIAAGWPRWWHPDSIELPVANRPVHARPDTGEYLDSFGNKVYVYAVANPGIGKSKHRYVKAHEKGSGFGLVEFDTQSLSYTVHAFPFLADLSDSKSNANFPGWPVTIYRDENAGDNVII